MNSNVWVILDQYCQPKLEEIHTETKLKYPQKFSRKKHENLRI